jgi:hypothetical protein
LTAATSDYSSSSLQKNVISSSSLEDAAALDDDACCSFFFLRMRCLACLSMLSDDNDDTVDPVSSLQLLTTTMIFLPVPVIADGGGCAGLVMLEAMKFARRNIVEILAVLVEKRLWSPPTPHCFCCYYCRHWT